MTVNEAKALKSNIHACFDSAPGKEVMLYIEKIGGWYPSYADSNETNDIIARDANRRLIGTLKSIMMLTPEQIATLTEED